jgi:hypothetical protein
MLFCKRYLSLLMGVRHPYVGQDDNRDNDKEYKRASS